MRNIYYIARKELREYFSSVIGYVFLTMLLMISGRFYRMLMFSYAEYSGQIASNPMMGELPSVTEAVLGGLFDNLGVVMVLVVPMLSMRLFAAERRNRTLELLLTSPVSSLEIVLGKFFGSVGFFVVFLLLTLHYPILIYKLGHLDIGPAVTTYLGALLMGASCLAIGLLASSLTQHQIVAGILAFAVSLILWVISWGSSADMNSGFWAYVSILEQYQGFTRGLLRLEGIIYFLSLITLFLFATLQRIEMLRRQ